MGTWSPAILGNDTSCEVRERFIELYDKGEPLEKIEDLVMEEQEGNLDANPANVWLGLAMVCWECKALAPELLSKIKDMVASGEIIAFDKELKADSAYLKQRQKYLEEFVRKISNEKEKARRRHKPPQEVSSDYPAGTCLAYKNGEGNYRGVFIMSAKHYKNHGSVKFLPMDFESGGLPDIEMFKRSKLHGLVRRGPEWKGVLYGAEAFGMTYDKADKTDFYAAMPNIFRTVGRLCKPKEELLHHAGCHFVPVSMLPDRLEELVHEVERLGVSEMTLEQLLDVVT